jgi:hypothetical protein
MVKIVLFVLILIGIMIYPVIESKNIKQTKTTTKKKPPIEFYTGEFYEYEPNLAKTGTFKEFILKKDKSYYAKNVYLNDKIAKYDLYINEATYRGDKLFGKYVNYYSKEYNLTTDFAIYNTKTSHLNGDKFAFNSNTFKGFGVKFDIDKQRNIKAKDITYFLKVDK